MPKFSLRTMLSSVAFVGCSIAALVNPSVWWAVALPAASSLLMGFAVSKMVLSEGIQRAFWASFFVSCLVYLAVLVLVKSELQDIFGPSSKHDVWQAYLGMPVWEQLHGEVPYTRIVDGRSRRDFLSFLLSLHVVIAVIVSSVGAFVTQFVLARGSNGSPADR